MWNLTELQCDSRSHCRAETPMPKLSGRPLEENVEDDAHSVN